MRRVIATILAVALIALGLALSRRDQSAEPDAAARRLPKAAPRRPIASSGCTKQTTAAGSSFTFDRAFDGGTYKHQLTLPPNANAGTPMPIVIHHHWWQGDYKQCQHICTRQAPSEGFIALALTGMGPANQASWNGSGSVASPGSRGPTCEPTTKNNCYPDCNGKCSDNCWFSTCKDSVAQVVDVLDYVEANYCVDLTQVWASGCSNGAIFLYQLAQDPRIAYRLAGIVSLVGAPMIGFLKPPLTRMSYIGFWGESDTLVPGIANTNEPDKALDTHYQPGGWYYHSSRAISDVYSAYMGCRGKRAPVTKYKIPNYTGKSSGAGLNCTAIPNCADGRDVVECYFNAGHLCNLDSQWTPIFAFMKEHPKV